MPPIARFSAAFIVATVAVQTAVLTQGLEVRRHNPSEWTKRRFSEVVTVNGPGRPSTSPELARRMRTVPRAQAPPSCIPVTPMSSAGTRTTDARSTVSWFLSLAARLPLFKCDVSNALQFLGKLIYLFMRPR